jgi:hypothetical protein
MPDPEAFHAKAPLVVSIGVRDAVLIGLQDVTRAARVDEPAPSRNAAQMSPKLPKPSALSSDQMLGPNHRVAHRGAR